MNGRGVFRWIFHDKCSRGNFCSKLEMISVVLLILPINLTGILKHWLAVTSFYLHLIVSYFILGHLKPFGSHRPPLEVETLKYMISPEDFYMEFVAKHKPVVFTGNWYIRSSDLAPLLRGVNFICLPWSVDPMNYKKRVKKWYRGSSFHKGEAWYFFWLVFSRLSSLYLFCG